jgi:hypothetical protein
MTENMDPTKSYFQTIKTSLKSVVKNPVVIEKLTDAALLTSRIMTHTSVVPFKYLNEWNALMHE